MPNWIEGTLKLRGDTKCLQNFFEHGILPCANYTNRNEFVKCHWGPDNDNQVSIWPDAYIEDTKRAFVANGTDIFWNDDYATVCIPIKQAWGFEAGDWLELANKYNLDVKLYGIECGMEFMQEIEIVKLEKTDEARIIVRNTIQHFDDWEWECPFPYLGG